MPTTTQPFLYSLLNYHFNHSFINQTLDLLLIPRIFNNCLSQHSSKQTLHLYIQTTPYNSQVEEETQMSQTI